jgi:hypothetical protein
MERQDSAGADLTRVRSPGWWLQLIACGHAAVGTVVYRDVLAGIVRDKVFRTVPDRGDRATAFWFMTAAPSLWVTGRLLRSAEARGDVRGQRIAGGVVAGLGLTGATAMPISGFWTLAAVGIAAARNP